MRLRHRGHDDDDRYPRENFLRDVDWPDERDDPDEEPGENLQTHLLPDHDRLRAMSPEDRRVLVRLVANWTGAAVDEFRARVAAMDQ